MSNTSSWLKANRRKLETRWPEFWARCQHCAKLDSVIPQDTTPNFTLIIDGIHLSSAVNRADETQLQAAVIPQHSHEAWVYGIGTGELIEVLLQRPQLKQLHVVPMNFSVFRQSLRYFDHQRWLSDQRIVMHMPDSQQRIGKPFTALPACLRLAANEAARIRDLVVLELSTSAIRKSFRQRARVYQQQIEDNLDLIKTDGDATSLFQSKSGASFLVASAGPTLSDHYQEIRRRRAGSILISVDAALQPLVEQRLYPDVVVSIDGERLGILQYFDFDLSSLNEIPLVYFPIVHRQVLQRWPGPRFTAYADHEIYHPYLARQPKGLLFASGTVTHAAVDLAVNMGAKEVNLLGADFCFAKGLTHVPGTATSKLVQQSSADGNWVINGYGERVPTLANLKAYLRDLEQYIARHPEVTFVTWSQQGARIEGAVCVE